jgi:hypothetical protein
LSAIQVFASDQGIIPDEANDICFESWHYIDEVKQEEYYCFSIKDSKVMRKIVFKNAEANGTIAKESESLIMKTRRAYEILQILNYIRFLELPENISAKNQKQHSTTTLFKVSYTFEGVTVSKQVKIEDIDEQVEQNTCPAAFKLKFLMLALDFQKGRMYKAVK